MPISEEQLKEAMEGYGNIRFEIEMLKSNKQTVLDKILEKHPEVRLEIEEAEEELGSQLKEAEKQEKFYKATLQSMIEQFSKDAPIRDKMEIKTPLLRVGLTKKVSYDPVALDGMAMENPKLLAFRTEEISSRITLNKL
jgi:hypothetical protein